MFNSITELEKNLILEEISTNNFKDKDSKFTDETIKPTSQDDYKQ